MGDGDSVREGGREAMGPWRVCTVGSHPSIVPLVLLHLRGMAICASFYHVYEGCYLRVVGQQKFCQLQEAPWFQLGAFSVFPGDDGVRTSGVPGEM